MISYFVAVEVGKGDVFSLVRPCGVDAVIQQPFLEVLSADGTFQHHADCHGDLQQEALDLTTGGFFQKLILVFVPRGSVGALLPVEGLAFLTDGEVIFPAQLVGVILCLLEPVGRGVDFDSRLEAHRIDDDVRVNVIPVNVSSHQTLILRKLMRCPLLGNPVGQLWCNPFTGGEALDIVVILPPTGFVPETLCSQHLGEDREWVTGKPGD